MKVPAVYRAGHPKSKPQPKPRMAPALATHMKKPGIQPGPFTSAEDQSAWISLSLVSFRNSSEQTRLIAVISTGYHRP